MRTAAGSPRKTASPPVRILVCAVSKFIGWRQRVLRMNELFKFCLPALRCRFDPATGVATCFRVLIAVFIFTGTRPWLSAAIIVDSESKILLDSASEGSGERQTGASWWLR